MRSTVQLTLGFSRFSFLLKLTSRLTLDRQPTLSNTHLLANAHFSLIPYAGPTLPRLTPDQPRVIPHGFPVGSHQRSPGIYCEFAYVFIRPLHLTIPISVPLCFPTLFLLTVPLKSPFFQHNQKKKTRK